MVIRILSSRVFLTTIAVVWALVLLTPGVADAAVEFEVERFVVKGENPVSARETEQILRPYLGTHSGIERLQAAAQGLENALRDQGFAFYRVNLPPQKLVDGGIALEIKSFKIVEIQVEGLDHFSEENVLNSMPELRIGTSPNIRRLSHALAEANRHPSKYLQVTFAVNRESGDLGARVSAIDQKPTTGFTWLDNTGTERTGNYRIGLGFQHANVFNRDHVMTVTGTASPEELDEVRQLGIQYRIPLYRFGGDVEIIAADSSVDSATFEGETFEVSGAGQVVGLRLRKGLPKIGELRQDIVLSWFDKRFQNETRFVGTTANDTTVNSQPLGLEYRAAYKKQRLSANWYIGHYANVGGGSAEENTSYDEVRLGANSNWSSTRLGGNLAYQMGDWSLRTKLTAQTSDDALIPGEQFTFGGMRSVRGFSESEFADDRGVQASIEIWGPKLSYGSQVLGFLDYGYGRRVTTQVDPAPASATLGSIGVGVRWAWRQKLKARLDFGYVVEAPAPFNDESTDEGDSLLHASFIYLF